jgi:hypothetical protein
MERADGIGEPLWAYYCRVEKKIHPQWLQDLQETFVCNFAPGFRAGAFVNGYTNLCASTFPAFKFANVPLWIWWGNNPVPPRDQKLMKKYLPTEKEVNQAKELSNKPYPERRRLVEHGREPTRATDDSNVQAMNLDPGHELPSPMHPPPVDDVRDQPMDIDEGPGPQLVVPNTRSSTNVQHDIGTAPDPIRGSFQLHGEELESFITRMKETLAAARLDEDDEDLELRALVEKQAEVQRQNDTLG